MATGIQTGIRRGSRVSPAVDISKHSVYQRCQSRWGALSRAAKGGIIACAVVLQILLMGLGFYSHQSRYVDLYPTKLQQHEVPEISRVLLEMEIEHEVTPAQDGVLLLSKDRIRARALLASRNLPLHRVVTAEETPASMGRTAAERRALEQRILEGEITLALRDVKGVLDARVKLSVPERSHFSADDDPTRASITLTTRPGHTFDRAGISGLLHLVAFSVPGLAAENVSLVDSRGFSLSDTVVRNSDGGLQTSGAHFEVRSSEEERLRDKLQQALDIVLPGRTRVVVNLDLDFSTSERRLYTPGSEKDDGMVRDSFQLVTEMLGTEKGETDKKDFENRKESVNYKYTENYMASLSRHARVELITATVFANGVSAKEAASLEQAVKGSLGLKAERGDFVYIDSTPWDVSMLPAPPAIDTTASMLALDSADRFPNATSLLALLLTQTLLVAGGFAGYLFLSSRRRSGCDIQGSAPLGLATTGIVDHHRSKTGETAQDFGRTGAQTTEMLEGIVRERPNQVADLLRSTWLS
jgi:flagellar M-ring protein FliF